MYQCEKRTKAVEFDSKVPYFKSGVLLKTCTKKVRVILPALIAY